MPGTGLRPLRAGKPPESSPAEKRAKSGPRLYLTRGFSYSIAATGTLTAGDSGVDGAAALPLCALSDGGCLGPAFVPATAFRGVIVGLGFLAAPFRAARLGTGLATAGLAVVASVAFFGAADLSAGLAFLASAQRRRVAATIRARPSGLSRRFFFAGGTTAGFAAAFVLSFRAAAQRLLCAAAIRLRAPALRMRFVEVAPASAVEAG